MTLSYCWGSTTRYLTTKSNFREHLQAIPTDALPLTFQHAITVCRFLGCRYVWIDALCIIQDSPEDVERELADMGDIYRNSILTITAAGGFNASSGLFASRDSRWNRPCEIVGSIDDGNKVSAFGGHLETGSPLYQPSEPAYDRRWVYQEEVLSIRELTFGSDQMSWRCMSCIGNETMPVLETEKYSHRRFRWVLRDPEILRKNWYGDGFSCWYEDAFSCWYDGVGEYNSRSLAYLTDKLRAIAGLAAKFQQLYGGTYLAGLWEEDIQCGLSWAAKMPWYRKPNPDQIRCHDSSSINAERMTDKPEYVAPSWSWASVHKAGLSFASRSNFRPHLGVQLLHYDIGRPSNATDPFSRVTHGALTLRGRARRGKLCLVDEEEEDDDRELGYLDGAKWGVNCVDSEDPKKWVGEVVLDDISTYQSVESQGFVEVLCLLVVACSLDITQDINRSWFLRAVAVVPVDEKAGTFRRVGLLHCGAGEDRRSWFGDLSYEDDGRNTSGIIAPGCGRWYSCSFFDVNTGDQKYLQKILKPLLDIAPSLFDQHGGSVLHNILNLVSFKREVGSYGNHIPKQMRSAIIKSKHLHLQNRFLLGRYFLESLECSCVC
jgi:hypothetical protein